MDDPSEPGLPACWQALTAAVPAYVVVLDRQGRVLDVNRTQQTPKTAVVGNSVLDFVPEPAREAFRQVFAEGRDQGESRQARVPYRYPDGRTRTFDVQLLPTLDAGAVTGFVLIAEDVTDRTNMESELQTLNRSLEARVAERTRELEAANEQLQRESKRRIETEAALLHSQKMETVGSLAAGIAHDFNNLLGIIGGYAEVAGNGLESDGPLADDMREIREAVARGTELTRQLLIFARREPARVELLSASCELGAMERVLRRVMGVEVEFGIEIEDGPHWVRMDRAHFEQVVMNLVVNARHAVCTGGQIDVRMFGVRRSDGARVVALEVSDDGHGMDEETQARIFEPYFTTKGRGEGSGLGLATVHAVVEEARGHIEVHSEVGRGTTIRAFFPTVRRGASEPRVEPSPAPVTGGTESILLVEDDDTFRRLVARILREAGYTVLPARNAGEAILLFDAHGDGIDLLLTDVIMPHRSGLGLAECLRDRMATLPVLFVSGYERVLTGSIGNARALQKPLSPERLLSTVRELLDAPSA